MQWEEAQQCNVLLFPEGMVKLNDPSSEILKRCDGSRTMAEIITDLKSAFPGADLEADVMEFLAVSQDKGWLVGK